MTIRVTSTGTGLFKGHETSIGFYEYSEGAMPHDVFDQSGEVGQLSFQVDNDDKGRSILLYRDGVELQDDLYGFITGSVNGFNYADGFVEITGTSRLNLINTEGVVTPEVTTVAEYLRDIFNAASITSDIIVAPNVSTKPIVTPGYEGNLWVLLKQFAALHQLDVSLIRNTIFVRPMREREITIESVANEILTLSEDTLVQKFEVAYYNYEQRDDALAYPIGGWEPSVEVYSVEANETVVFDIPVDAFLSEVKQPIVSTFIPKDYTGPDSVYTVSGNDGLPIPTNQWTDFGGRMSFELTDLGRNIRVTLRGPSIEELSPYSISLSDGATEYSTLRIVGTGVFFDRQVAVIPTGLTSAETPQEFGQEIDNVFISTFEEAYDAGVRARRRYALPRQVFDTTGRRLERRDFREFDYLILDDPISGLLDQNVLGFASPEDAIIFFASFQDYANTLPVGYSFADFNQSYASASFDDFTQSLAELVTQSFGTIAGSRVRFQDAYYRVRNTTVSAEETAVSAEYDTLFKDVSAVWSGKTFADFTNALVGLEFDDYALIPLRTEQYLDVDYFVLDQSQLDVDVLAF